MPKQMLAMRCCKGGDLPQRLFNGARADAGVDEKLCIRGADIGAVPRGAGKQRVCFKLIHDKPKRLRARARKAR